MCTNPQYVNSHSLIPRLSNVTTYFGCGRCLECQTLKKSDIFARLVCEFLTMREMGFFTLFTTHTYNDKCMPSIPYTDITAFSKEDIRKFFNRVRSALFRKFGFRVKFKVFLVCEYGGTNHRAHYHILWFVELPKTYVNTQAFTKCVFSCWNFGFNYTSHVHNGVLRDASAINYACKYIIKDIFTLDYMHDLYKYPIAKKLVSLGQMDIEQYMPFYRISNGLGFRYCEKHLTMNDFVEGSFNIDAKTSLVVPRYFLRKKCYDALSFHSLSPDVKSRILKSKLVHSNFKGSSTTIYVLNDFGKNLKRLKYDKSYNRWRSNFVRLSAIFKNSSLSFFKKDNLSSFSYADFFKICSEVFGDSYHFWYYLNFVRPYSSTFVNTDCVYNGITDSEVKDFHIYQPFSDELLSLSDCYIGNFSIIQYLEQLHYESEVISQKLCPYGLSVTDLLDMYQSLMVQLTKSHNVSMRTTQKIMYNAKSYYYAK